MEDSEEDVEEDVEDSEEDVEDGEEEVVEDGEEEDVVDGVEISDHSSGDTVVVDMEDLMDVMMDGIDK